MQEIEMRMNTPVLPPWDTVVKIADCIKPEKWVLVGGLMVQAHAMIAGRYVRATSDIDMLIDVMADTKNIHTVIYGLESLGFELKEPGLRGTAFHRMMKEELIVDLLIADHLPSNKRRLSVVNRWPMLEVSGGAQAVERKSRLNIFSDGSSVSIITPDLLGALIMKAAAYISDTRDAERHLQDVALLSSLVKDHVAFIDRLHGSDKKRLRAVAAMLKSPNNSAWLLLDPHDRTAGIDTLRILTE